MQVRADYLENATMASQLTKARGGKKKKTESDNEAHQVSSFTFALRHRTWKCPFPIPTLELRAPGRRRKTVWDLNVLDVAGDGIWEMILTFCSYSMAWRRMTLCIENIAQKQIYSLHTYVFFVFLASARVTACLRVIMCSQASLKADTTHVNAWLLVELGVGIPTCDRMVCGWKWKKPLQLQRQFNWTWTIKLLFKKDTYNTCRISDVLWSISRTSQRWT